MFWGLGSRWKDRSPIPAPATAICRPSALPCRFLWRRAASGSTPATSIPGRSTWEPPSPSDAGALGRFLLLLREGLAAGTMRPAGIGGIGRGVLGHVVGLGGV